jgi:hypothetical protein
MRRSRGSTLPLEQVIDLRHAARTVTSLDRALGDDSDETAIALVANSHAQEAF